MSIQNILLIDLFLIGLCIGSFLNVVIYRLPIKTPTLSLSLPKSHCPICKHQLSWYENIPVLSWCVLKGRCRQCKTSISIKYPIFELISGLLLLTPAILGGISVLTVASGLAIITLLPYVYWIKQKTIFNTYMYKWGLIPILTFIVTIIHYAKK